MNNDKYRQFSNITKENQPRPNSFYVDNRRHLIYDYIEYLIAKGSKEKALLAYNKLNSLMPEAIAPFSAAIAERNLKVKQLIGIK